MTQGPHKKHPPGFLTQRCLVGHLDNLGPCTTCAECGKWIRPNEWNDPCDGKRDDGMEIVIGIIK